MGGPVYGSNDSDVAWWDANIMAAIGASPDTNTIIYVTQNLKDAGAATWEAREPVDAASFERGNLFYGRVKFAPTKKNEIHVIGYADGTAPSSLSCWHFKSTNLGTTWTYRLVRDDWTGIEREYTVTYKETQDKADGSGNFANQVMTHSRIGDDVNTVNPWAMAWQTNAGSPCWDSLAGGADAVNDFTASSTAGRTLWGNGNWLLGDSGALGYAILDDYFGAGGYSHAGGVNRNMPLDAARVKVTVGGSHATAGTWIKGRSWVFWHTPSVRISYAFDIARDNETMYVGFIDAIYYSLDAGYTWLEMVTGGEGAYDICVDPLLYGVIYYWSAQLTDKEFTIESSKLYCRVAMVKQSTEFMSSKPTNAIYRIHRDFNTGKIWGISNSTIGGTLSLLWRVVLWDLSSKTVLFDGTTLSPAKFLEPTLFYTGFTFYGIAVREAISLKYYFASPVKLIYVDKNLISISDDAGATWSQTKKGDWATYLDGVVGHRLPEPIT